MQAGKLFNKLTKMAAAKINESKGADSGGDSGGLRVFVQGFERHKGVERGFGVLTSQGF